MNKETGQNSIDGIDLPIGKISFAGTIRTTREYGANEFRIEFPGREPIFGEWRNAYAENGNTYKINIVSFGYADPEMVGSPHPLSRISFSESEKQVAQKLIALLFGDERLCDSVFPIAGRRSLFLGDVVFAEDWIKLKPS